jgi:hypothetical protein
MAPQAGDTYTFPRAVEMPLGTANGVLFLNGSKVVTSGSGLTFDGMLLSINGGTNGTRFAVKGTGAFAGFDTGAANDGRIEYAYNGANTFYTGIDSASLFTLMARSGVSLAFGANGSEQMRLTSTGLGIGTSSPSNKLHVNSGASTTAALIESTGTSVFAGLKNSGSIAYIGSDNTGAFLVQTPGSGFSTKLTLDSSGNLGLGVTPSASTLPTFESEYGIISGKDEVNILQSAYYSSGNFLYSKAEAASRYLINNGTHAWFTAPSGTAGNAISFTQALTLDANRNLALNTTSVGTSAAGVLSVGSGTEPSSGPADTVQFYSVDRSAGNTIPAIYCEGSGVTNAGITNVTVTNKIAIKINGTVYYLLATTDAT